MSGEAEPYAVASQVDDQALVERRRAQIVAAATELFGRKGFHRTTIRDIAAAAGVSIGLIYQYVRDKDDVLLLVLLDIVEAYQREIPPAIAGIEDPVERLEAAVGAYCRVVDAHSDGTQLGYRDTHALDAPRLRRIMDKELETNALIARCVEDCVAAGRFRPCDTDLVAYQLVMLAHSWALKRWHLQRVTTLDRYVKECLSVFLHGLLAEGPRPNGDAGPR